MPRNAENFLVRPLFFAALSGEFPPPGDSLNRVHSLGMLAYDAFTTGELYDFEPNDQSYTAYRYTPSWAPNVVAQIDLDIFRRSSPLLVMHGLELTDNRDGSLYISNHFNSSPAGLFIGTSESDIELPLEQGEALSVAKMAVTHAAQNFFDSADY